jgi:hypothetical protein
VVSTQQTGDQDALREQQWLLPLSGAVVGALLAIVVANVDRQPDPDDWAVTVDRARDTMMSILAILFAGLRQSCLAAGDAQWCLSPAVQPVRGP